MTEKQFLALEWLYRMACSGKNCYWAVKIQDMLIDAGIDVDMTCRRPLRKKWPKKD